MKGPSSHLHVLILGLALTAFVSCKGGEKPAQTSASESKPAPAPLRPPQPRPPRRPPRSPRTRLHPPRRWMRRKAVIDSGQKGPWGSGAVGKPAPA
jgi:hypothetical protein